MKILIDNGHGVDTAGKRSPDGSLREYKYAREIAEKVVSELKKRHVNISMTQSGDPLENAIAERANGILKVEWLYKMRKTTSAYPNGVGV